MLQKKRSPSQKDGTGYMATITRKTIAAQLKGFGMTKGNLCWRNLCLVTDQMKFYNVSGYVRPDEMLCVMGGPDSGVIDLLKVLSKKTEAGPNVDVYGEMLLNGNFPGEKYKRIVAYIPKTENHYAYMNVRETLEFSASVRAPTHMDKSQIQSNVDTVLKWLDMTDETLQQTYVGDATLKGISGGQKRRLSFGVEVVSGFSILIADLPTNGLDAKTAFSVVQSAKHVAAAGKSMIMSLVQPSPELFDLFDNVLLLCQGHMIYFGPQTEVEEYFLEIGFIRPPTKSVPAWLEEISANPIKYYGAVNDDTTNAKLMLLMVNEYRESQQNKELGEVLWENSQNKVGDFQDSGISPKKNAKEIYGYDVTIELKNQALGKFVALPKGISWFSKMWFCFKRQLLLQSRDTSVLMFRAFQALSVSILLGWIFWKLEYNVDKKIRSRMGFLFFCVGFMGFGAVPFIPGLSGVRSVFYYQRDAQYYQTSAYYVALIFAELPFTLAETFLFACPCYFMSGMQIDGGKFIYFYYICFAVRYISWSACMSFVGLFPSAMTAQIFATAILPVFFAFNGFLVPQNAIPWGVKYFNWLSFFAPALRGLVTSELDIIDDLKTSIQNGGPWSIKGHDEYFNEKVKLDEVSAKKLVGMLNIFGLYHQGSAVCEGLKLWIWFICFNLLAVAVFRYIDWDFHDASYTLAIKQWFGYAKKYRKKRDLITPPPAVTEKQSEKSLNPPTTIEWSNLNYTVQIEGKDVQLLRNISGFVKPGEVVALMGPSGAGKSTLLDVLAGKKNTGVIQGNILVNGRQKDQYFTRIMGYVEQFDSHMDTFTVYEAIKFSAELRLPGDYSAQRRENVVNRVIRQLGLESMRDSYTRDISQEERKKTTIAVELVSEPGLLFLDEPTTGLDSGAALNVMETVSKLAKETNLTVLCTIHQPSANVYSVFDNIVLLKSNPGEVAYFGPCCLLNDYYERSGFGQSPYGKNPADWAIEALNNVDQPGEMWYKSPEYALAKKQLQNGICQDKPKNPYTAVCARSGTVQFQTLIVRAYKAFKRDTASLYARYTVAIALGIIFGGLYYHVLGEHKDDEGKTLDHDAAWKRIKNLSMLFLTIVYATESAAQEIPCLVAERAMFYREIDSKLYSIMNYYLSRALAQIPFLFIQTCLFSFIFVFAYVPEENGKDLWGKFAKYWICLFLSVCTATTLSQFFAIVSPTDGTGNVLYTTFCTLSRLMCGFLTFISVMPDACRWFNVFDFFKYAVFYLGSTQLAGGENEDVITQIEEDQIFPQGPKPVESYIYLLVLFGFYLFVHLMSTVCLNFLRWDSR